MYAHTQEKSSSTVPEIMKANWRKPCIKKKTLKGLMQLSGIKETAMAIRENKASFLPFRTEFCKLLLLMNQMLL
jgi:hypothetical protein